MLRRPNLECWPVGMQSSGLLFLAIAPIMLLGCHSQSTRPVICGIPQLVSQEIYLTERAGLEEQAYRLGYATEWKGPSDSDAQRQLDFLTRAIADKRYGIAISPTDTNSADGAISDALSKDIPVVVIRNPIALSQRAHLSFLLEDDATGAQLITRRLQQLFPNGGEIAILGIDPNDAVSLDRLDALDSALRSLSPKMNLVERVVASSGSGRVQVEAEKALLEHPQLVSLIALNPQAGMGAVMAIGSSPRHRDVKVMAWEQSLPLLLRLRAGKVDSVLAQNMRLIGQLAVENIHADREKQPYPSLRRIKPLLVTADNINTDGIQNALLLNWEPQ